jgi:hypothetical protein
MSGLRQNTTPTAKDYGTVNLGDGRGNISITEEQFRLLDSLPKKASGGWLDTYQGGGKFKSKGVEVPTGGLELLNVDTRRGGKLEDRYYAVPGTSDIIVESRKFKTDRLGNQLEEKFIEQSLIPGGFPMPKNQLKYLAGVPAGIGASFIGREIAKDHFLKTNPVQGLATAADQRSMVPVTTISPEDEKQAEVIALLTGLGTTAAIEAASTYRDLRKKGSDKGIRLFKEKKADGGWLNKYK